MNVGDVMAEFSAAGITKVNVAEVTPGNGKPNVKLYATEVPSEEYTNGILGIAKRIVTDAANEVSVFHVRDSGKVHLTSQAVKLGKGLSAQSKKRKA